jgi:hypothetical protein
MASNMSDLLEKNLIDYVLKTANSTNMTAVTSGSIWAGLCTSAPSDTATNECTVASYARKQVPFINAASGDAGCIGPSTAVAFDQCTGTAWGDIVGYALFPASSGSTGASQYLAYGVVSPSVNVTLNDTVSFAASAMTLSFA